MYVTLQAAVNVCAPELAMSPGGECRDDSKGDLQLNLTWDDYE